MVAASAPLLLSALALPRATVAAEAPPRIAGVADLAGQGAWLSVRRDAAAAGSAELEAVAAARADVLALAERHLAALVERDIGLLAARRAVEAALARVRTARDATEATARRLDGPVAAGLARVAGAGGGRPADRAGAARLRALAGGVVASWSDALRRREHLGEEAGRLARQRLGLDRRLADATAELRRADAAAGRARGLALPARRGLTEALLRRDALTRTLAALAERRQLAASSASLGSAAAPALAAPALAGRGPAGEGGSPPLRAAVTRDPALLQLTAGARAPLAVPPAESWTAAAWTPAGRRPFRPSRPPPGAAGPTGGGPAPALLAPIAGSVLASAEAGGMSRRLGVVLETAVAQTVSAPWGGTVAFAARFKGFGLLLIIDRGDGYHALLSGLSRLDVAQGAGVVAGQAVGAVSAGGGMSRLYLELRHLGAPVDPSAWPASLEDGVRG